MSGQASLKSLPESICVRKDASLPSASGYCVHPHKLNIPLDCNGTKSSKKCICDNLIFLQQINEIEISNLSFLRFKYK